MAINFISSSSNDEEHVMHTKSDNIEILVNDKPDKVIEEIFQSLAKTQLYPSHFPWAIGKILKTCYFG